TIPAPARMARVLRGFSMVPSTSGRAKRSTGTFAPVGCPIPWHLVPPGNPKEVAMKDGSILEVTALFEDTVMSTTTLGRPRRAGWPLVVAGALGLGAAALAVARGVDVAERNERAAAAFAGPSRAFRAERLGAGWDAVVLAGLAGGLGLVLWGLLRRERPRGAYLLGGAGSDVPVDGLAAFPLVARRGDDWVFSRPDGMTGDVVEGGVTRPLPDAVVLRRSLRVRGVLGPNTFFLPPARPPPPPAAPPLAP